MLVYEDQCRDCAVPGYPCLGSSCPNRNVPVHYCDECGEPIGEEIYEVGSEELCEECLKDRFRRIE